MSFKKILHTSKSWLHDDSHTHTHTHSCTTGVCAHSPCPEGLPPAVTHVIPLSLEEEECEDEGIEGGGGVRVVSSYQHQKQLCKKKEKLPLLCTGPFVLYNQWMLWSLNGPDSVSSSLTYWSSVPGVHGSANNLYACTDHVSMSCVKAITAGIRCLVSTQKVFHKLEAFMALNNGYLVAIKVGFYFKVKSDPKRLAFAAQVKK